jgi:hypothetical protein
MSEHTPRDLDQKLDAHLEAIKAAMPRTLYAEPDETNDFDRWAERFLLMAERRGMRIIIEPMVPRESDREG